MIRLIGPITLVAWLFVAACSNGDPGAVPTAATQPTATAEPTEVPLPTPFQPGGELPFDLEEYEPLIADLQRAFSTRDGALLESLIESPEGTTELWIGNWGGCGAGVRVVPVVQENLDALFAGEEIELVSVAVSDTCPGTPAFGLISTGWQSKVLPHTYSGDGGPTSGLQDWLFEQDEVLLVFWSAGRTTPEPAFFGIAPFGEFVEVAPLPEPGDAP